MYKNMPQGKGTYGSQVGRPPKKTQEKKVQNRRTKTEKKEEKMPPKGNKEGRAKLGGKEIKFEKGGLHRSLKVPMSFKFSKAMLERFNKKKVGEEIMVEGNKIKLTPKIKKQLTLGINLMSR